MAQTRLENIDLLRAVAALTVCFAHFEVQGMMGNGILSDICTHGHLGVDVFFVISGFVIPLSLLHTKYRISDWKSFLGSRFLRLYPAYFSSIIVVFVLWYIATWVPGFSGTPPTCSMSQLASNLLLYCDFNDEGWFINVFWTLAIEAQYYVLIAISFPMLLSARAIVRRSCLSLWIVAPLLVGNGPTVFSWTSLFAIGIVAFLQKEKKIGWAEFTVVFIAAAAMQVYVKGWPSGITGLATALVIMFLPSLRVSFLTKIGGISYSLYLIHLPIGSRVSNLANRLPEAAWVKPLSVVIALSASLAAAVLFFHFIEKPSHKLARRTRRK